MSNLANRHIAASERIPKYLFRMWHARSGGNPKLNSKERIIPPAFYGKENSGHRVVCAITRQHFVAMAKAHLSGRHSPLSEFSSWSSSLRFVLGYACSYHTAHISVIDTERLKHTNSIFHTPSLSSLLGTPAFSEEYLAHGVIEGEAHMAVSYQALLSAGLFKEQQHDWMPYGKSFGQVIPITHDIIQNLYNVAGAYGPELQIPMTLAMVCLTKRSGNL